MPKVLEGVLKAENLKLGIVAGRFNHFITDQLVEGALDAFRRHGGNDEDVTIARVPGSFEMPAVASKMAKSGKVDVIVGLGVLIRGATSHYDLVASEVAKGLAQISLDGDVPVIFGVVTAETIEQAIERAGTKAGNRGFHAVTAAIEMANLYKSLGED